MDQSGATIRMEVYGPHTYLLAFLAIYLLAYVVLFRKWGPRLREEATSCFLSLFHGTPAVLLSFHALFLQRQQHDRDHQPLATSFASVNTSAQNTALEFSMSYFFMDLLHYLVFFPTNLLFILHHLATLYVFLTCRYAVGRGASGLLVLLILAEVTSPFQNIWSLSRLRRGDVPLAAKLYELLTPPFLAFYSLVRGLAAPVLVFKMFLFFVTQETTSSASTVPAWAWISWMVVIVLAISVSVLWVSKRWSVWSGERRLVQNKAK